MNSRIFRELKRSFMLNRNPKKYTIKYWNTQYFFLKDNFLKFCFYSWWEPIEIFLENCKRTLRWLPIIWKDRHWDYVYILNILQNKIRFTREAMDVNDRHVTTKKDCFNMRKAELLLERLKDSNAYTEKDWEEHFAKWPSQLFRRLNIENERKNINTDHITMKESEHVKFLMKREEAMWQQDFDALTKLLKKQLRKWWE